MFNRWNSFTNFAAEKKQLFKINWIALKQKVSNIIEKVRRWIHRTTDKILIWIERKCYAFIDYMDDRWEQIKEDVRESLGDEFYDTTDPAFRDLWNDKEEEDTD